MFPQLTTDRPNKWSRAVFEFRSPLVACHVKISDIFVSKLMPPSSCHPRTSVDCVERTKEKGMSRREDPEHVPVFLLVSITRTTTFVTSLDTNFHSRRLRQLRTFRRSRRGQSIHIFTQEDERRAKQQPVVTVYSPVPRPAAEYSHAVVPFTLSLSPLPSKPGEGPRGRMRYQ